MFLSIINFRRYNAGINGGSVKSAIFFFRVRICPFPIIFSQRFSLYQIIENISKTKSSLRWFSCCFKTLAESLYLPMADTFIKVIFILHCISIDDSFVFKLP